MTHYLGTGGYRSIATAQMNVRHIPLSGFVLYLQDGPLDAPDTMPAGSVSNQHYTDWRGRPVPHQTETTR